MSLSGAGVLGAIRNLAGGIADLLLPEVCVACGSADIAADGLCKACNVRLLSLVSLPYCPRCGTTVGPNIPIRQDGCSACQTVLPRFTRVFRLGPYTEPLRGVIRRLKYHRDDTSVHRIGRMLAETIAAQSQGLAFDLVVPVPMHWRRRLMRGCDHAFMLAAAVGRELNLPVGRELLRLRNTPPQVHLPRSKRIENVRGAFATRSSFALAGANVLLIDDVTTTGATANEAARTLLRNGASGVTLAVAAKAEPPTAYTQHWT